ncbi:hypothetical protein ACFQDJ_05345 [Pseudomonas brassicacearum]
MPAGDRSECIQGRDQWLPGDGKAVVAHVACSGLHGGGGQGERRGAGHQQGGGEQ